MKIETHFPATVLKPFIKKFMIIESDHDRENKVLPDTSIVMAFSFKGQVTSVEDGIRNRLPLSVVSGLRKSPRLLNYAKATGTLLVIFNELGAAAFFKVPLHELFGKSIPLDNLFLHQKVRQVEGQLSEAQSNRQRIAIVQEFLLSEIKIAQPDLLVMSAVQNIKSLHGDIKIRDLLKDIPISQDPLEKRFRRLVGTSPKQFSTLVRMRHFIANHSTDNNLTVEAYSAGYFDQAHFIKDFKSFTGQTPSAFFKFSSFW